MVVASSVDQPGAVEHRSCRPKVAGPQRHFVAIHLVACIKPHIEITDNGQQAICMLPEEV